jgi:hypothetical protein
MVLFDVGRIWLKLHNCSSPPGYFWTNFSDIFAHILLHICFDTIPEIVYLQIYLNRYSFLISILSCRLWQCFKQEELNVHLGSVLFSVKWQKIFLNFFHFSKFNFKEKTHCLKSNNLQRFIFIFYILTDPRTDSTIENQIPGHNIANPDEWVQDFIITFHHLFNWQQILLFLNEELDINNF